MKRLKRAQKGEEAKWGLDERQSCILNIASKHRNAIRKKKHVILKWVYCTAQSTSSLDMSQNEASQKPIEVFQEIWASQTADQPSNARTPCPLEPVWEPQSFPPKKWRSPLHHGLCVTSYHHTICSSFSTLNSRKAMASSMHFGNSSSGELAGLGPL